MYWHIYDIRYGYVYIYMYIYGNLLAIFMGLRGFQVLRKLLSHGKDDDPKETSFSKVCDAQTKTSQNLVLFSKSATYHAFNKCNRRSCISMQSYSSSQLASSQRIRSWNSSVLLPPERLSQAIRRCQSSAFMGLPCKRRTWIDSISVKTKKNPKHTTNETFTPQKSSEPMRLVMEAL